MNTFNARVGCPVFGQPLFFVKRIHYLCARKIKNDYQI